MFFSRAILGACLSALATLLLIVAVLLAALIVKNLSNGEPTTQLMIACFGFLAVGLACGWSTKYLRAVDEADLSDK